MYTNNTVMGGSSFLIEHLLPDENHPMFSRILAMEKEHGLINILPIKGGYVIYFSDKTSFVSKDPIPTIQSIISTIGEDTLNSYNPVTLVESPVFNMDMFQAKVVDNKVNIQYKHPRLEKVLDLNGVASVSEGWISLEDNSTHNRHYVGSITNNNVTHHVVRALNHWVSEGATYRYYGEL